MPSHRHTRFVLVTLLSDSAANRHTLRRYLTKKRKPLRQAVLALVILVAPITVWGYYFPIQ